jgi:multiple sugar transport system ATP-binding protein
VIVGIRPESLADPAAAGVTAEPGASLTADVQLVEVLGSGQLVHFTIDARRVRDESELSGQGPEAGDAASGITATEMASGVARIDPRARIRAHGRTAFTVDVERLHFFDPETGLALGSH